MFGKCKRCKPERNFDVSYDQNILISSSLWDAWLKNKNSLSLWPNMEIRENHKLKQTLNSQHFHRNHGLENVTMNSEDYWDLLFLFILPKFLFALKFAVPLWININQSASRYLMMIMMNDDEKSWDNHDWGSKRYLWMGQKAQWFDNGVWADGLEKGLNWDFFLPASTFSSYLPFLV